jgi:hypothetical protein
VNDNHTFSTNDVEVGGTNTTSIMDFDLTASNYNSNTETADHDGTSYEFSNNLDLTDPQNHTHTENSHHDPSSKYDFNGETIKPNKVSATQQQQQDFGGFSNTLDIENAGANNRPSTSDPNYDASHRYANSNSNYENAFAHALDDGKHDQPGDGTTHVSSSEDASSSSNNDEQNTIIRRRNRRRRCIGGGGLVAILLVWFLFGGIGRRSYGYYNTDDQGGNSTMVPTIEPSGEN